MSRPARLEGSFAVRDGRVAHASEGFALLVGRPAAELVGRPAFELLAPEDRARVEDLRARGGRGEAVPAILEVALLLPDGRRRPVEVHVDHDGGAEVIHLRDLGEDAGRRQLFDALAEIGARLRAERSEEGVHARVRSELGRLGAVCALLRAVEGRSQIVWVTAPEALRHEFTARTGAAPEGFSGPMSEFARRVVEEGAAFTDDWAAYAASYVPRALAADARSIVQRAGFGRSLGVRIEARREEGLYLVVASPLLQSSDLPAFRLFGAQVSAALDAARTIADLSRRNDHLAVLARVAELAGEATDLAAFLAAASDAVRRVSGHVGGAIYVPDEAAGDLARIHLDSGAPPGVDEATRRASSTGPVGEALRSRTAKVMELPYAGGDPAVMKALAFRTIAWVPLVARSRGVGVLVAAFETDAATARASLDLLTSVGAHFASVIESHGLVADLRRRVDEQAVLFADVRRRLADLESVNALTLRVFANAPGDLGALLNDACRELVRALSAQSAAVALVSDGGETLRVAASVGAPAGLDAVVVDLSRDGLATEVIRTRAAVQVEDITHDPRSQLFGRADLPPLAALVIPVVSRRDVRGVVYVADRAGRRFGEGEEAVANALAAALGLGIENAELYADARRRVEELSVVNEASRQIAGSLELPEVLRAASAAARRLVGATRAWVLLAEPGSGTLRVAGCVGVDPHVEGTVVRVEPGSFLEGLLRSRRPAVAEDVGPSQIGAQYRALLAGRALAAVPVLLRGELLGVLVTDDVTGPRRFTDADLGRLTAVADRLAVGIENARLYLETRRRAEQLGLLHELGRSLVATLDLEQLLSAGVRSLARIVDAPAAYLALAVDDGRALELRAIAGVAPARVGDRISVDRPGDALGVLVYRLREPVLVEDALTDPRVPEPGRRATGARAYLGLPLVVRDRVVGTVVIVETRGPRQFTPAEVERAAGVANQLAVAAENARLYEDLRRSYAELARAQQQLLQGERLAALGELSAVVAHEVRNPLGVIFNSLGSLRRLVQPTGDAKMLFDIVEEEADRLNRIVGDLLDFARPSSPELRPESLGRVAEDAVGAAVLPSAERIDLVRELDPDLPAVAVDARLVRQAVLNVAVNALQAMPRGGRLTLRTLRDGGAAVVELEDTGVGIPEEVRGRIFEPFFTTKASGTGLGLAVVRRIVEGHGGEVRVRSTPGAGTTFALRFPIERPP